MSDVVLYESRGPAAWITLNRPEKLNALNKAVVDGLFAAMGTALADDGVKVVVLTGAGRAFSAGYDIGEEVADEIEGAERWHRVLERDVNLTMELWSLQKPTIAAVRGWCLAGACELAMACDLIVAAEDARFGEPEIRYGSGPVALVMPFVLGQKKTNELLFTGDTIDAAEAHRVGRRARGRGRGARAEDRAHAAPHAPPDEARAHPRLRGHGRPRSRSGKSRPLRDPERRGHARAAGVRPHRRRAGPEGRARLAGLALRRRPRIALDAS
jgi:enoyl-CoA hydratase/carnithine racemase